jgi:hypothetical protein
LHVAQAQPLCSSYILAKLRYNPLVFSRFLYWDHIFNLMKSRPRALNTYKSNLYHFSLSNYYVCYNFCFFFNFIYVMHQIPNGHGCLYNILWNNTIQPEQLKFSNTYSNVHIISVSIRLSHNIKKTNQNVLTRTPEDKFQLTLKFKVN